MRKFVLFLLFLFMPLIGSAQILKERRVYYLDCSYSMVQFKIWNTVRDNLINAIDKVSDETTELIVIPFAFNTSKNPKLSPMVAMATTAGKDALKAKINALPTPPQSTMTYHYVPVNDFYDNRVSPDRVTYMFLMTDGQDEDPQQRTIKSLLPQWGKNYGNKNVFGFYVMLHGDARNKEIDNLAKEQEHFWKVETADVNINLIRLQSNAIFNAKNEDYFDLPYYGNVNKMSFNAQFDDSSPYKVNKVEKKDNSIRIWVDYNKNTKMPVSLNNTLHVTLNGGGKFDFLVTDDITVKCEYKPERSLKISVR